MVGQGLLQLLQGGLVMEIRTGRANNVVVTGGAGFIGSHLCETLLARGYNVTCIDNLRTGKMENMASFINNPQFKFINASITEFALLIEKFKDAGIVYHQAGLDFVTCEMAPGYALEQITDAMIKVTQACIKSSVPRIIFASTGSVLNGNPASCYGIAKLAAELMLKQLSQYNPWLKYTILRYYNVYGTRQNDNPNTGGVIPIFINNSINNKLIIIHGDGSQTRQFTSVNDVVRANIYCGENDITYGQTYDVCSDRVVSISELAYLIAPKLPVKHLSMRNGDVMEFGGDNTALKALGFEFDNDFETNISHLMNWMVKHES